MTEVVVLLLREPQFAGKQAAPFCVKVHVTPALAGSFETVAAKFIVCEKSSVADEGDTLTEMAGTVIVAEAVFVESAAEVAVIVTPRLLDGAVAGAV